jgi:hypothetical protein
MGKEEMLVGWLLVNGQRCWGVEVQREDDAARLMLKSLAPPGVQDVRLLPPGQHPPAGTAEVSPCSSTASQAACAVDRRVLSTRAVTRSSEANY